MRRIRGPSFSPTKLFLRDSKQPPVNSGRELQPVSERRHIRLVLDKCSDWYPIQFVQTNYSAPTEHISFVRINKLSYRMVYNKHSCSTWSPSKPLQGVLDLQVKNWKKLFAAFCSFCSSMCNSFLQLCLPSGISINVQLQVNYGSKLILDHTQSSISFYFKLGL